MNVTTGGISVGVGALIVGTLAVAGVLTVRDENDGRDDCQPQPIEVAKAATQAFMEEYLHPEASSTAGAIVMPSDQARELLAQDAGNKAGIVSKPLPEWSEDGYVVVVDHHPKDDSDRPGCFDETPILYVVSGPRRVG